ncbi:MAG: D-hexose-6-phosphate mutarotase [Colwellia sp.]|nr:D-hexose-6-phosphate mutarotase [Colwellia sp.]
MSLLAKNEFGQVNQVELSQGLFALVIEHSKAKATISLYGGQVLSWQPQGQQEVFWLSNDANYKQGKAIRGGIPLCWPWFGAHPNDNENKAGNHGFAREQLWQCEKININEQGIEICLVWQGENMNALWPFACQLTQVLFFGQSFKQTLIMQNLSGNDAYYTGALHSYFSVSSPKNIKVAALELASFDDKLTGQLCSPQVLENGVGPIDRIYHTDHVMTIIDSQWQRVIELQTKNTQQWVFWNPGVNLANNMADIHHGGEQEFVCLEAANTQKQLLAAGSTETIEQQISVFSDKS